MRIVAIDQGTTSTKAVLAAPDGQNAILGNLKHRQILPQPGWVEHDATELLANVRALIDEGARQGASGVALANQGETIVAWDRQSGRLIANAIVWQDQRTSKVSEALTAEGKARTVLDLSGLPLDPYFSATKLKWILDNVEDARSLARQGRLGLGTSDSFFIERLTGRYATDVTTASRTSLMNLTTCRWDPELSELFGVPMELLPQIYEDGEQIGVIETSAGQLPLVASAVDQIAALYGHGCRRPGDGKVTVGTGAFALAITGYKRPDQQQGIIPTAAWPTKQGRAYAVDGGVYTASAAVEWLMRIGLLSDLSEIDRLARPSAAERHLFFVPALSGLACPHWDRSAAGLFIGIDAATGREDLIKAVLEGVAFRIAEVVDALGFRREVISVDGGLTRSRYFMSFLADVCGCPLLGHGDAEITAVGVAALGMAAAQGQDPGTLHLPLGSGMSFEPGRSSANAASWRPRFTAARQRSIDWRE